jgi:hypothetical protein
MRNHLPFSLVLALTLLGDGASLYAQGRGNFNRVTTAGARRTESPSSRVVASAARSDSTRMVAATSFGTESLRPYASQSLFQTEGSGAGVPRYSTQQEQPAATRQAVSQSQSHNYFPGMRPARAIQQPVGLTARSTGVRHICTPSRSQMMGGGHHR